MNMNNSQTTPLKTPQQLERVNQIIGSFRQKLSKSCGMLPPKKPCNRVNHAHGLTDQRVLNHRDKEFALWSARNKEFREQVSNDMANLSSLSVVCYAQAN